jgi:hypothetical protein
MVTCFIWTPIYVSWHGSMNGHQKDMCLQKNEINMPSKYVNHSRLRIQHNRASGERLTEPSYDTMDVIFGLPCLV